MKIIYLSLVGLSLSLISYSQVYTPKKENGWYHIIDGQQDSISCEPIVTVADFADLSLIYDSFDKSVISGKVSRSKLSKWADATEKSIGKRIGFVFNDTVITAPQVNARIDSGYFQISTPHGHDLKRIYLQLLKEKENFIESLSAHCFHEQRLDTAEYKIMEENLKEELQKPNFSSRAIDYMRSDAYKKYKSYICKHPEYINLMFQSFLFQESVKGLYGHLIDDIVKYRYPEAPSIWIMATKANHKDSETTAVLKYQKFIRLLINEEKNKKENSTDSISVSLNQPDSKLLREEAYQYRATITDSTFLKTKGIMSDKAIDLLVSGGWNKDYAYNQVVYLKALERAKRHLSVKDNKFIYLLKSGNEINISEDIHQYICRLFEDWNRWVADGRCKIAKDENGFYEIIPNK
ncbi:SecDF P1 head subdomain-containing protein [Bacteroides sp. CG01]|uniref:SecDF P1 head subdomain-containing protein n=1 Tax=Bacteroides sp. CG01 TaxID=3096000 RepID=UPI002AFF8A0E|nr:hypothetical protein [Bacteroides sp. CG01]